MLRLVSRALGTKMIRRFMLWIETLEPTWFAVMIVVLVCHTLIIGMTVAVGTIIQYIPTLAVVGIICVLLSMCYYLGRKIL